MTPQHRQKLAELEEAYERLTSSSAYRDYLRVRAAFHAYSFQNRLLIAFQRPDASRVAGYKKWQSLGRQVRKGERGIVILAPLAKTVKDEETGERRRTVVGFTGARVFDISQTDGQPLPEEPNWRCVSSEELEVLELEEREETLCAVARGLGVLVSFEDTGSAGGYYAPANKVIGVNSADPTAVRVRSLVHELVHALGANRREEASLDYAAAELVTDAAAALVCSSLGVDTLEGTAAYLADWSDGSVDRVKRLFTLAEKYATELERLIGNVTAGVAV